MQQTTTSAATSQNRGYWGYQEMDVTQQQKTAGAGDGDGGGGNGGCGGGCGCGVGDGSPATSAEYSGGSDATPTTTVPTFDFTNAWMHSHGH